MKSDATRVREDPSVRRAQIVEEAIRLLGQRGYNGFTIHALAERCGISNAGLLYYFGSKDQLLLALLDELERRDAEAFVDVAKDASSGEATSETAEALRRLLRMMAERFSGNAERGRLQVVLLAEAMDSSHPAHEWFGRQMAAAEQAIERLVSPWSDDPGSTARQLVALMVGLAISWFRSRQGFDLVEEWEKGCRMVLPAVFSAE